MKENEANSAIIMNSWTFLNDDYDINRESLEKLCELNRILFAEPKGPIITESELNNILLLVDEKYGYCRKILQNRPINILLINSSFKKWTSGYFYNENPANKDNFCIALTHTATNIVHPAFSFLHELGHAIHTRITETLGMIPRSFEYLVELVIGYSDRSKPIDNYGIRDCFAEFFAIAALLNSPYASYDHHDNISDKHKEQIAFYYDVFMKSLPSNLYGMSSWDTILSEYKSKTE